MWPVRGPGSHVDEHSPGAGGQATGSRSAEQDIRASMARVIERAMRPNSEDYENLC